MRWSVLALASLLLAGCSDGPADDVTVEEGEFYAATMQMDGLSQEGQWSGAVAGAGVDCGEHHKVDFSYSMEGTGSLTIRLTDGNGTEVHSDGVDSGSGTIRLTASPEEAGQALANLTGVPGHWVAQVEAAETGLPTTPVTYGFSGEYSLTLKCVTVYYR